MKMKLALCIGPANELATYFWRPRKYKVERYHNLLTWLSRHLHQRIIFCDPSGRSNLPIWINPRVRHSIK